MRMPPVIRGVVNPQVTHVHPYPTRYHGPIYTRPVFGTPYVRAPQAVFMPNDFHTLGSLGGAFGALGAVAVGSKMVWMSAKNARVVYLQDALNKILASKGFLTIKVDGIFGKITCGALAKCLNDFNAETMSAIDNDLLREGIAVCNGADPNATWTYPAKDPAYTAPVVQVPVVPAPVVEPPPVVAPPVVTAPVVPAPTPEPTTPPVWTTNNGQSEITYTPTGPSTTLPELDITGETGPKVGSSKTGLLVVAAVAAGGLGLWWFFKKK